MQGVPVCAVDVGASAALYVSHVVQVLYCATLRSTGGDGLGLGVYILQLLAVIRA